MKSLRLLKGGYTILEVMIVLIVSATLFTAAVASFNRQNYQRQFSQAVKDLEVQLQDILNDVGTGYYPSSNNILCDRTAATPAKPKVNHAVSGKTQGSNQDCIFVGKAVNIAGAIDATSYRVHTIVGLTNKATDATAVSGNLDDANPIAIVDDHRIPGAIDLFNLHGSMAIKKIFIDDGSNTRINGFAVVTGFGRAAKGSGATTSEVSIAAIPAFNFVSTTDRPVSVANLDKAVTICLEEAGGGTNSRRATITLGSGSFGNIDTKIDISWPGGCS